MFCSARQRIRCATQCNVLFGADRPRVQHEPVRLQAEQGQQVFDHGGHADGGVVNIFQVGAGVGIRAPVLQQLLIVAAYDRGGDSGARCVKNMPYRSQQAADHLSPEGCSGGRVGSIPQSFADDLASLQCWAGGATCRIVADPGCVSQEIYSTSCYY